jgi:hypothetical protein
VLPDGTKFTGPAGLRDMLLGQKRSIVQALTEKLMLYALGRGLEFYDAPAIRKIVNDAGASNYAMQSIVVGIVKSTPFQMRKTEGPTAVALHQPTRAVAAGN